MPSFSKKEKKLETLNRTISIFCYIAKLKMQTEKP